MDRILVADDEIDVCNILREFLRLKGYEVETANDGEEAIRKVREFNPHIVLLDIVMPKMKGLDVLKEIQLIDPKIGVIMITGVIDSDTARHFLDLGAFEYITKPLSLDYLENVLMLKMLDLRG